MQSAGLFEMKFTGRYDKLYDEHGVAKKEEGEENESKPLAAKKMRKTVEGKQTHNFYNLSFGSVIRTFPFTPGNANN